MNQAELIMMHKMPVSEFHTQNNCSDTLREKTKLISKLHYVDLKVNMYKSDQQLSSLLVTLLN